MKYYLDILAAIVILGIILFSIYKPLPEFSVHSLQIRGLDGYSINTNKANLIVHVSNIECMACKRDTQVLMRFHNRHQDIPIIDANILYKETDKESLISWKNKIDLQYSVGIIENPEVVPYSIPTTLVVTPTGKTEIFGALTYEKLLEATRKNR